MASRKKRRCIVWWSPDVQCFVAYDEVLDIYIQGVTFEEAQKAMASASKMYVKHCRLRGIALPPGI